MKTEPCTKHLTLTQRVIRASPNPDMPWVSLTMHWGTRQEEPSHKKPLQHPGSHCSTSDLATRHCCLLTVETCINAALQYHKTQSLEGDCSPPDQIFWQKDAFIVRGEDREKLTSFVALAPLLPFSTGFAQEGATPTRQPLLQLPKLAPRHTLPAFQGKLQEPKQSRSSARFPAHLCPKCHSSSDPIIHWSSPPRGKQQPGDQHGCSGKPLSCEQAPRAIFPITPVSASSACSLSLGCIPRSC